MASLTDPRVHQHHQHHQHHQEYVRVGIGGAGNYYKGSNKPPLVIQLPRSPLLDGNRSFSTGIGGAGNRHKMSEAALFALTDQTARLRTQIQAQQESKRSDVHFFGIGGAGNRSKPDSDSSNNNNNNPSDRRGSASTDTSAKLSPKYKRYFSGSGRDYVKRKLSQAFGPHRSVSPTSTELRPLSPAVSFHDSASSCSSISIKV